MNAPGSHHYIPINRGLLERASETLLAWAHYFLVFDQERLVAPIDEDPVEAVTALRCQLRLAEAATRRARHLLAMATAPSSTETVRGEGGTRG